MFFDWEDIGRVSTPGGDLDKAKMIDVLKDFKKRFAASVKPEIGLLRCKEDFDSIYHESCTMQPKTTKTEVCCCPEQFVWKAGEKKCKEVEGAEKEKLIFQKTPVLDKQTEEEHGGFGYLVWQQVSLEPWNPAEKAPVWLEDIEPESKGKFQWRKSKLQNASIECAKWERLRTASIGKSYCLKHKMTLVCDAGQVLYEQVPGYDLHQDEFACREMPLPVRDFRPDGPRGG